MNANGIQELGESGIPDVTVNLYNATGVLIATTLTNATGYYYFSDLVPGDYYVEFILPPGYTFSPQDQGTDDVDSEANITTGETTITTLLPGENDITWFEVPVDNP